MSRSLYTMLPVRCAARRGFMVLDAVLGLSVVAAIATLLIVSSSAEQRAMQKLRGTRSAGAIAESAMVELQQSRRLPPDNADTHLALRRLLTRAPAGQVWVEISVTHEAGRAELVGLVPAPLALENK